MESGMPNFICVALAMIDAGYEIFRARLDSGDLCVFTLECKKMWEEFVGKKAKFSIFASNDLHEE
jgi:nicotinate phosphoribosyltransferase